MLGSQCKTNRAYSRIGLLYNPVEYAPIAPIYIYIHKQIIGWLNYYFVYIIENASCSIASASICSITRTSIQSNSSANMHFFRLF